MSAFVVSRKTINAVCQAFRHVDRSLQFKAPEDIDALGAQLWKMNCDAVNQRYTDTAEPEAFKFRETFVTLAQKFKSVQCLSYQCMEGNVPETQLYKALERIEHALAGELIRQLPAYEAAAWDLGEDFPAAVKAKSTSWSTT